MKKILLSVVLIITALLLISCEEPEAATFGEAFGPGHHAIAHATITTDGSGKISVATFEEYHLPDAWAIITGVDAEVEDLVVLVGTTYFAKYVSIDGEIFTLHVVESVAEYVNSEDETVLEWAIDELNAKRYVEACIEGRAFVCDSEGVKSAEYDQVHLWTKIQSGYWQPNSSTLGYQVNVNHLINSVIGRTLSEDDELTRGTNKVWSVNDATASATNNDFDLYYDYLVQAFTNREIIE